MKTTQRGRRPGCRRRGFTLLELLVAAVLTTMLAAFLAGTWISIRRSVVNVDSRARIAQEANLALAALANDCCGSLANPAGRLGTETEYPFVGRMEPSGTQLWLCFDGGSPPNGVADWGPPDWVIYYEVQGTSLVRFDQNAGTSYIVANHVQSLSTQDLGSGVQISLTFSYRNLVRTYNIVAKDP